MPCPIIIIRYQPFKLSVLKHSRVALSSWYTVGKHTTKLKAGTFNPDRGDRGPGLLFPEVATESMTLSLSQDHSVLDDLEQIT